MGSGISVTISELSICSSNDSLNEIITWGTVMLLLMPVYLSLLLILFLSSKKATSTTNKKNRPITMRVKYPLV